MKPWTTPLELAVNGVQIPLLLGISVWLFLKIRQPVNNTARAFLAGGLFCFALGDLFSELYMLLHGGWPPYFSAADIAWLGSFCFFIAVHRQFWPGEKRPAPWYAVLMALLTVAVMVLYTVRYGSIAANILYTIPLAELSRLAGQGLHDTRKGAGREALRPYYASLAAFLGLELALLLSRGIFFALVDCLYTAALAAMGITFGRGTAE